jgi:hypothetical protein
MPPSRGFKACVLALMALNVLVLFTAMSRPPAVPEFEEINVQRINIREPNGTLKLVISNSARQQEGTIGGQPVPLQRIRPAGMIFFSDGGDEIGGLVFGGDRGNGSIGMMFDQYGQDQVIGLQSTESIDASGRRQRQTGLSMWDRPFDTTIIDLVNRMQEVESISDPAERAKAMQEFQASGGTGSGRLFIGRTNAGEARLNLRDGQGRARLRLSVTEAGEALIEFLDEAGTVVRTIRPE